MIEPTPTVILECSRCHDLIEIYGAASAIGDPYVCVQCLDPRHAADEEDDRPPCSCTTACQGQASLDAEGANRRCREIEPAPAASSQLSLVEQ
jgi:hypothetical protein